MIQVAEHTQPKVWINGHYLPAQKSNDGNWYVEINGKKEIVNPNDIFGVNKNNYVNSKWEELNKDFEERKANHTKWFNYWSTKQQNANEMYDKAITFYNSAKTKYNNFLASTGCKYSELNKADKKQANILRTDMNSGRTQKIRSTSDSIFYGRMAVDEIGQINNYSTLQAFTQKHL